MEAQLLSTRTCHWRSERVEVGAGLVVYSADEAGTIIAVQAGYGSDE